MISELIVGHGNQFWLIGHASMRCQMFAQDSDSWSEEAAYQMAARASTDHFQQCNFVLSLVTRAGVMFMTLRQCNNPPNRKVQTHREQSQEHVHQFLWDQEDCSQRIHPCGPCSWFCKLLWHFTANQWKMQRLGPELWWQKELHVPSQKHTIPRFLSHQAIFYQTTHISTHSIRLTRTPVTFLFLWLKIKTEGPPFRHNWVDRLNHRLR